MPDVVLNDRWTLTLPDHRVRQWAAFWERERLNAMHDTIKPDDVVFDIGAEQGDISALIASWGAQVVLFEPSPHVWPGIKATFDANGLTPAGAFAGFAARHTNLSPDRMEPRFKLASRGVWPGCAFGDVSEVNAFRNVCERFHDTPQVSLDDWVTMHAVVPDVITMDVEGAELEVLKGADLLLSQHHPTVFVSVHPTFLREMYGQTADEVHAYMMSLGYTGTHLADDHESHWVFT